MGDLFEILLTTDLSSNQNSAALWDYNSGTCLHTYRKGGVINPNAVSFIRNEYLLGGDKDKPLIHVWPINGQEVVKNIRVVCSGKVSTLTVSQDGNWCAGGIGEQLHVWNVPSGQLIAIVAKHFQPIRKVLFTSDGSYVVSSGEDGLVIVWSVNRLVAQTDQNEPVHVLTNHTLPIVDFILSKTPSGTARIFSISLDCTMKIHELASGRLLLSVVFDKQPTRIAIDATEKLIFVGNNEGAIDEINLVNPPRNVIHHHKSESHQFKGHEKSITSLAVATDGMTLASGSDDGTIILWHILSKQKLRTIQANGTVSNVSFVCAYKNIFGNDLKTTFAFSGLQRNVSMLSDCNPCIEVYQAASKPLPFREVTYEALPDDDNSKDLQAELEKLKFANKKLYEFSLECVFGQAKHGDGTETAVKTKKKRKITNV